METTWKSLLDQFNDSVNNQDALKLGLYLLNIREVKNIQPDKSLIPIVNNTIIDDLHKQFFLLSLDYIIAKQSDESSKQIRCQTQMINLLSKKLLDDPSFYLTPIIIIAKNLRVEVFKYCPSQVFDQTFDIYDDSLVSNFTNSMQKPFKQLISNKSETKINISAIHIFASHLFSIYFKYNQFTAAINLYKVLNTVLSSNNFDPPILPTSSLFNYFLGKSLLIQSNYSKSYEYFQLAYKQKHSKGLHTKILLYLVPLQYVISDKLPTNTFFEKFPDLKILQPIYTAVKQLDLLELQNQIESLKHLLLHLKVYALYIHFFSSVQLQIIKLTHKIFSETNEKSHIIPFSIFSIALKLSKEESESILCRLIATDHIKGYLSQSNQVIVFSKTKPFSSI